MVESDAERILEARITGTVARYMRPPTEAEEAEAPASITDVVAGRTDLLAQAAGLAIGFTEGTPDEPRQRLAAGIADQGWRRPSADPRMDRGRPPTRRSYTRHPLHRRLVAKLGPGRVIGLSTRWGCHVCFCDASSLAGAEYRALLRLSSMR